MKKSIVTSGRALAIPVKTAKSRSPASQRWLARQLNDPYVVAAKKQGWRSRAAYKLLELDGLYHWFYGREKVPAKLEPGNPSYEGAWGAAGIVDYLEGLGGGTGRAAMLAADKKRPDQEKLKELYRWMYSREPDSQEMSIAVSHIAKHEKDKKAAYEDIVWALINTKEFLFNH